MKIYYDAEDLGDTILTRLTEFWPAEGSSPNSWEKMREEIRLFKSLAMRLYMRSTLTLDRELRDVIEDLELLMAVAAYRRDQNSYLVSVGVA